MSRGIDGGDVYIDETDRVRFLRLLKDGLQASGASLFSYCLMGNHFHLLVAVGESSLGDLMQGVLSKYGAFFNWRHGRVGHLFQARYRANLCRDLKYLSRLATYINENPVRAGFVSALGDWCWSSHRELMGAGFDLIDLSRIEELTSLRPEVFLEQYRANIAGAGDEGASRPLDDIVAQAAFFTGLDVATLVEGGHSRGPFTAARRMVIDAGRRSGFSNAAIAAILNISPAALSQLQSKVKLGV